MPFHVNRRTDLDADALLALQREGAAVMYVPAAPPYDAQQLALLNAGLRTRVPDAVTERFPEAFTVSAYRHANGFWLEKLSGEVRRTAAAGCPMPKDRVDFLSSRASRRSPTARTTRTCSLTRAWKGSNASRASARSTTSAVPRFPSGTCRSTLPCTSWCEGSRTPRPIRLSRSLLPLDAPGSLPAPPLTGSCRFFF